MLKISSLSVLVTACFALSGCKSAADPINVSNQLQGTPQTAASRSKPRSEESARQQGPLNSTSIFDPILSSLRGKTRVPLRLPSYLANEKETYPLYASIELVSQSAYKIQLAFTQDCTGGNVCHYGKVSGRAVKAGQGRPKGETVSLTNGLAGYFIDATCGATCSDSILTWDEDGYRYTVELKAEKIDTLRKVADSAIVR